METEYKYIIHPNGKFTAIKASTAARWAQERRAADAIRAQGPSPEAQAHARLLARRARRRAAAKRRKEQQS